MKVLLFSIILVAFLCIAASHYVFEVPRGWPEAIYDFKNNPLNEEKIKLGRILFYDPVLSRDNSVSCASCHSQYNAFAHSDHPVSHGINDRLGTRNAPALINLAWQKQFMWDGAVHNLDVQALAPLHNPDEMDETIGNVVQKLQRNPYYPQIFQSAFGDSVVTGEYLLKALTQFMLTLVSANSKYDSVQLQLATFTTKEQRGYALFKTHCNTCHTEPLFTSNQFSTNGIPVSKYNDFGRMKVTNNPKDSLLFKVPTLRNVEFSYPYMHDGRFKSLRQVLQHYVSKNRPIILTPDEQVEITAFLLTLTDRQFLFNPAYSYLSPQQ